MPRQVVSVSFPEELAGDLDSFARAKHMGRSEVIQQAVRGYLDLREWRQLQSESFRAAEARGIGPDDVERLVDEVRGST